MLDGEPSTSEVTNAAGSGRSLQRTPTFRQPVQLPEGLASKYIERLADVLLRAGRSHRRLLESLVTEMVTEEEPLPSRRKVAELFAAEGLALPPLQMRRLLQHFSMNDDAAEEVDVFRLSAALDKAMFAAVALMGAAHKTSNTVAGSVIIAAQGPRAPKEPVLKSGAAEAKKSSSADISDEDREAIFQLVAQGLRAEGADSMIDLSALREVIVTMNLEMVKVGVGCTACYQDTGQVRHVSSLLCPLRV